MGLPEFVKYNAMFFDQTLIVTTIPMVYEALSAGTTTFVMMRRQTLVYFHVLKLILVRHSHKDLVCEFDVVFWIKLILSTLTMFGCSSSLKFGPCEMIFRRLSWLVIFWSPVIISPDELKFKIRIRLGTIIFDVIL